MKSCDAKFSRSSCSGPTSCLGKFVTLIAIFFVVAGVAQGSTIVVESGYDIQSSIDQASPGDTVAVGYGQISPFTVDRPIRVIGHATMIKADLQKPAVTIRSNDAVVDGFIITGVPKDQNAKFEYYMENYLPQPGKKRTEFVPSGERGAVALQLNLPNAAILIQGDNCSILNTTVQEAQVGILSEGCKDASLRDLTIQGCDLGVQLKGCNGFLIESCKFISNVKAGLMAESSHDGRVTGCKAEETTHAGMMFRNSTNWTVLNNTFDKNAYGLALWNASLVKANGNLARSNYYGFLISQSSNNTIVHNMAVSNARSELVARFGVGISLQENSSDNMIAGNTIDDSFNGLEIIRGCERNVACSNNITRCQRGVRITENANNLLYKNNIFNNLITVNDNTTDNVWNGSVGNYYSDYKGEDGDLDGIGDEPYKIPMGGAGVTDYRPLVSPWVKGFSLQEMAQEIAIFKKPAQLSSLPLLSKIADQPAFADENETQEKEVFQIRRDIPPNPPKFRETEPMELERPPFTADI
jgi:nitrous oxidase accessory protein